MSTRSNVTDGLAVMALLLAGVAAATGLLVSGLYRDTAEMVREARAADLVTLAVAVPVLGLGLWRARAGSAMARLVAIGALGYLSYSYAIFAFSVVINPMTPVHIAILGLATWSFVLGIFALDQATVDRVSEIRLPRRTAGGFLIVVVVLFALLWLARSPARSRAKNCRRRLAISTCRRTPSMRWTLPSRSPCSAVAGVWLLRHDRRGPVAGSAALAFTALMGLSVLAIFAIDAAAGLAVDVVPVAIFGVVTGIAAILETAALFTSPREGA